MISSAINKAYIQYPVDVISGNVIAGKHIKNLWNNLEKREK